VVAVPDLENVEVQPLEAPVVRVHDTPVMFLPHEASSSSSRPLRL
jgi:hypothetical protein